MNPKVLFLTALGLTLTGALLGFGIATQKPFASAETVHVSATENQANVDASKQKQDNGGESITVTSTPTPATPSPAPTPIAAPTKAPCSN